MVKSIKERKSLKGGPNKPFPGKQGSGSRFKSCEARVGRNGKVKSPEKVCAAIGRSKYGGKKMAQMARAGRRK